MTNKSSTVSIIDSTLREGLQAPNVHLSTNQSMSIAQHIKIMGADMLEIGHPGVSKESLENVKAIVKSANMSCLAHSRANKKDVLAAKESGAGWVGIFIGINEESIKHRLKKTKNEILLMITESIRYAKILGLKVRFTVEDASRTDIYDLIDIYRTAISVGADRICYADTVGLLEPNQVKEVALVLRKHFEHIDIEGHFHNDRGLALANSLIAVDNGFNWISSSINGLGERCGITDTILLMANLDYRKSRNYKNELLNATQVSSVVSSFTRGFINLSYPIVGQNAFTHTAKLHINAVKENINTYSWQDPSRFDRKIKISKKIKRNSINDMITIPKEISAEELKYHKAGFGKRYVLIDERYVDDCRQYCIVRHIENANSPSPHVESHTHKCDSLFIFLGYGHNLSGLKVIVTLGKDEVEIESPASLFIPAGIEHTYRIVSGTGYYINHVLWGEYNDSLLEY